MRRPILAACLTLASATLLALPASADHRRPERRLSVGCVQVQILDRGGRGGIFFEFSQPVAYPGLHCTDACYVRGRHVVHQGDCPVPHRHFARYNYGAGYGGRYEYDGEHYGYGGDYGCGESYDCGEGYGYRGSYRYQEYRPIPPPPSYRIPAGHLPPPGKCRVWFPDRPAGHQPPPTDCYEAERWRAYGAQVIYGGPR